MSRAWPARTTENLEKRRQGRNRLGERRTVTVTAEWMPDRPWSPDDPELHVLRADLVEPLGGDRFDQRFGFPEFEAWVRRDGNHPSVVIWDVENEQLRGTRRDEYAGWVKPLGQFVRNFDTIRPIVHSGAGWFAPDQDMYHIHMEEHYTRLMELWTRNPDRPMIFGEYWVGGRGEGRLPSSLETGSQAEYTQEELRLYHEAIVEQRASGASGVMPFTTSRVAFAPLAPNDQIKVPADPTDPDPRPAVARTRFNPGWLADAPPYRLYPNAERYLLNALGPVTAFYWPRVPAAIEVEDAQPTIVVCNDSLSAQLVHIAWGIGDRVLGQREVTLAPAAQQRFTVPIPAPADDTTATLFVETTAEGHQPTRDELAIRGIGRRGLEVSSFQRALFCTDPEQIVTPYLASLGIETIATDGVPPADAAPIWIIAPDASDRALDARAADIRRFLEQEGRILCLSYEQLPRWCPVRLNSWSARRQTPTALAGFGWQDGWREIYFSRHAPIYAPGHPVFDGLTSSDLRWWNTKDGRVSDDAYARPAATGAVARGNWRPLLGASRRENMSLVELPIGQGLLMLCPAHVARESENPEARLLLLNLLRYLDSDLLDVQPRRVIAAGQRVADAARLLKGADLPGFAADENADVVIAGPGADAEALVQWANDSGGVAVILSAELTGKLPGFQVARNEQHTYMASRGESHRMLWGLATSSFEDHQRPPVQGEIIEDPADQCGRPDRSARDHAAASPGVADRAASTRWAIGRLDRRHRGPERLAVPARGAGGAGRGHAGSKVESTAIRNSAASSVSSGTTRPCTSAAWQSTPTGSPYESASFL